MTQFIVILLFSLLIGIEQRKLQNEKAGKSSIIGTDRTFTFIGILGFILYISEPVNFSLFITGFIILGILFGVYYFKKIEAYKAFGITNLLVALITYSLAPIIITQPKWFSILVVVSILILAELKSFFITITKKLDDNEFITLAKFLIIAGIILPIIPDDSDIPYLNISAYKLWLSVVAVSGISYLSYLLKKFVFKKSGLMITGILGGLYSSTATTLVLSRKSNEQPGTKNDFAAPIIIASAMMYFRILILMLIFNYQLGMKMLPYFIVLIIISLIISLAVYFYKKKTGIDSAEFEIEGENPLELKIAFLFSALFVMFGFITNFTLSYFGENGLNLLSYIVGFTDIDPFLLNLFQGNYDLNINIIGKASLKAIVSNNILKIIYTVIFANSETKAKVIWGLGLITIINILIIIFMI